MSKYSVSYLIPKTKMALTVESELERIKERKAQYEKHLKEHAVKGHELVSTSNLGNAVLFVWKVKA